MQIGGDIYSILEELCNIIHRDIERQALYIQVSLADKLDQCKGKRVEIVNEHIKILQEAYQEAYQEINIVQDKEKQKEEVIQDKEVFLYKLYSISLSSEASRLPISEPILIKEKVNNFKKELKILQFLTKTIPFLPLTYYKFI